MSDPQTTKYKLGQYTGAKRRTGQLSQQRIDYGKEHWGKIVVYDTNCKTIARRIIRCLNKQ